MEQPNNLNTIISIKPLKRLLVYLLRTFYQLLYHQIAWTYDYVAAFVSLGMWQTWVRSVLPYLNGPKILELGFGPGYLQLALKKKGVMAFGIDESAQMSRITLRRFARLGIYPRIVRGDAMVLPFANQSIDQAVMTFPAEFMLKSETYMEVHRVLIPGGKLIILPIAWITGKNPIERAMAWFNRSVGEAPEWDEKYLESINHQGYSIHWEMINFRTSMALLVQLKKI